VSLNPTALRDNSPFPPYSAIPALSLKAGLPIGFDPTDNMSEMTQPPCDLCGLPIEFADLSLYTISGTKRFCCEGCHGIYQMLHEGEILESPLETNEPNPDASC
jgi:hypothetical protein